MVCYPIDRDKETLVYLCTFGTVIDIFVLLPERYSLQELDGTYTKPREMTKFSSK